MRISLLFIGFVIFVGLYEPPNIPISVQIRWLVVIGLFILFLAHIGQRITSKDGKGGKWDGVLIDDRKKISLSRLQIILWTTVVLSAWSVIALQRAASVLAGNPVLKNNEILNIVIPPYLLLAMGISVTSLAGAELIKANKTAETSDSKTITKLDSQIQNKQEEIGNLQKQIDEATKIFIDSTPLLNNILDNIKNYLTIPQQDNSIDYQKATLQDLINKSNKPKDEIKEDEINKLLTERNRILKKISEANIEDAQKKKKDAEDDLNKMEMSRQKANGAIAINSDIADAKWNDLFRGDLISNYYQVEISKVQMFFFTVVLVFIYGTLIWVLLGDSNSLSSPSVLMPDFSSSMVQILGISHAGYLAVKQIST